MTLAPILTQPMRPTDMLPASRTLIEREGTDNNSCVF